MDGKEEKPSLSWVLLPLLAQQMQGQVATHFFLHASPLERREKLVPNFKPSGRMWTWIRPLEPRPLNNASFVHKWCPTRKTIIYYNYNSNTWYWYFSQFYLIISLLNSVVELLSEEIMKIIFYWLKARGVLRRWCWFSVAELLLAA